MSNFLKSVAIAAVVLSASMAQAGGPVLIEEGNNELIAETPASKIGILPIIGALALVCLVACGGGGGDGGDPGPDPDPEPDPDK